MNLLVKKEKNEEEDCKQQQQKKTKQNNRRSENEKETTTTRPASSVPIIPTARLCYTYSTIKSDGRPPSVRLAKQTDADQRENSDLFQVEEKREGR